MPDRCDMHEGILQEMKSDIKETKESVLAIDTLLRGPQNEPTKGYIFKTDKRITLNENFRKIHVKILWTIISVSIITILSTVLKGVIL